MIDGELKKAAEEIVREHAKLFYVYKGLAASMGENEPARISCNDTATILRVALLYVARDLGVEDVAFIALLENMIDKCAK